MTQLQSGYKVKCLRSDRGGEFLCSKYVQFYEDHGIQRQLTMAYTPQQNGVAERKNRTVVEMAKYMLHEKEIPYFLWAEAVHTAVYILNRGPTKALNNITPFEAYSGRKPGYATCEKGYRVYDLISKKLTLSRNIIFDKESSWNWSEHSNKAVALFRNEHSFGVENDDENATLSSNSTRKESNVISNLITS
ncbi:hypothetical protein L3X38_024822 [Prunus dulcis]|uniref:Integrase catalytic domain-containing protein n=1 Tax=Prunus dulcis TaxID=3755 RepID=A0AAD4Z6V8_PRUDU|nr:hypothetical protein L3X38_024822 [Prunus dulcis]